MRRRRYWPALLAAVLATPLAAAQLTVGKTTSVVADRVSQINPKALPGATVDEMVTVTSPVTNGLAAIAGVTVTDSVPAAVKFCVADLGAAGSGPIEFTDGTVLGLLGSGLAYRYISLASTSDSIDFSTDGTSWSYTPAADASGCDPAIRSIRVKLAGSQAAGSGFRLRYRVIIK